ncbi:MAG: cytidine deaminase [Bacteroidetes bacterium]|nr:cytidine deaminase [Bacteroidota bacterium]
MQTKEIKTIINEYNSIEELPEEQILIVNKAKEAAKKAYAPYSKFNVGACVLLKNGEFIQGNNQENAAYPSGLCAERVAMFYANAKYPDVAVKAIAICAYSNSKFMSEPVPPCGSCRQVLLETEVRFNSPIKIILFGENRISIIENAKQLLPLSFDNNNFD